MLMFFFFNDTATTEIYTLSLHDALPICADILQRKGGYPAPPGSPPDIPGLELAGEVVNLGPGVARFAEGDRVMGIVGDRKSTRLNSSHANISYAVFCLKKKKALNVVAVL